MTTPAVPSPPKDKPVAPAPSPPPAWRHWLPFVGILVAMLLWFVLPTRTTTPQTTLTYSQFLRDVDTHQVLTATLSAKNGATGKLTNGHQYDTIIPVQATGSTLLTRLEAAKVSITAASTGPTFGSEVLSWMILLLPFLLLFWLWRRMSKGAKGGGIMGGMMGGAMSVGKSKAKIFDAERPDTTFADVAGYEGVKAEIAEVVDFLRAPDRYRQAGAVAPRGVLMIGPPGTGKTLLARAVAGEASVVFFSVTGSSFVEMFVGVGAARVRDLFAEARKRAPAIVFIDEIDAIGQRRAGAGAMVSNDEREQTLNQMLAEMDGFEAVSGVVVLAATNRPEVLDPALLRPGRFDRQVTIPLPTQAERAAILAVHCQGKRLGGDVDLDTVARATPGFSGADLANLTNEAAIGAVRADRRVLSAADFGEARDRILLGRREGSNVLLPDEKHAVAVHEAGHALVAALSPHADPVAKVTILPAGQTLGVTEQLPLVERHLYGEDWLLDALTVRLGGRAAELVALGQGSTGAANDLAQATDLATKMVREFGLSRTLGPVGYPTGGSVFLGGGGAELSSRPFAETTQALIDHEVAQLLKDAETRALDLLTENRDHLDRLIGMLTERETVDGDAVYEIIGADPPSVTAGGTTVAPRVAAAKGVDRLSDRLPATRRAPFNADRPPLTRIIAPPGPQPR